MDSSSPPDELTPRHVRAARALLAWSQQELAKAAGVATSTVADFERGQRKPVANNAQAIRTALESAGVSFLEAGAVIGPPVPQIAQTDGAGLPIRWVTAEDLARWANRTDGVENLPTLVAFLIRATHGAAARLRFPANESIRFSGWDGQSSVDEGSVYVPEGEARWEIGAQRTKILQKADDDYRRRTLEPGAVDPADAAFIFVTPRRWPQKDEWAQARAAEGVWREVRAYDGDDLVHWIEQNPSVGLWLATRLGNRPAGTRELDALWEEWSLATEWPLTGDLVLSDRDEDADQVLKWLRGDPKVLSIQATTAEEVAAFFWATIGLLPGDAGDQYRARVLVAMDAGAARALADAAAPLILVLTEPDPGLAQSLADHGHYVLQAYDERPIGRGEVRILARPSREGIANALVAAGFPEPRARALARDSARDLTVLRRLIPSAPGRQPVWADKPSRALLAAMLAGGWDEDSDADKAMVAELANMPYDEVAAALSDDVGDFDRPLRKIGSTWRMASPRDAWVPLAAHLTAADLQRFEQVATAVLGAADPRFDMESGDRWMAAVHGVRPDYSGMLRHGIGQVLILLGLWGDEARNVPDARRRADAVVRTLLHKADGRRWWSLSRDFRLLAEASPTAFLDAIEDSLDQNDPPIRHLFGSDEGGLFATEHIADLLWALEALAWSPQLLPRVSLVLARLDVLDNPAGKMANRPANSLREIFLLWYPQTNGTLDERLQVLDLIRRREPDAAWKLMMGILPQGHDSSSSATNPIWRDFSVDKTEVVTWALIGRGAGAIVDRLVKDVGLDWRRWVLLIGRIGDTAPNQEKVFAALEAAEPQIHDKKERAALWQAIRSQLHRNRMAPDAEWAMPAEELDRLEAIYDRFAPEDPLERVAWLFVSPVRLPNPSREGWESEHRDIDEARQAAALAVFQERGARGILDLARLVTEGGYLGKALCDAGAADLEPLLEMALRSDDAKERDVAHGLVICLFQARGQPWAEGLLARIQTEAWGDVARMSVLRALPHNRWTWGHVAAAGAALDTAYWERAPIWWIEEGEDAAFAIRKLIDVGRARHALSLAGRERKEGRLSTALLVEVLQQAIRQPFEDDGDSNSRTMFQHYVVELLQELDRRDDVDTDALARLEWQYLPVLTHSRRPAKVLVKAMSEQPELFIEMIRAIWRPSEQSGYVDPPPQDLEQARAVAHQAFQLLEHLDRLPGQADDGVLDVDKMEAWIREVRRQAHQIGRDEVADIRIGTLLSASPAGADGNWPAEPVREVLDLFRSPAMGNGFLTGKSNRRGVTGRLPRDGGEQERALVAQYRAWAKAIGFAHPFTAKLLEGLADRYDWDARRADEDAERLDWET